MSISEAAALMGALATVLTALASVIRAWRGERQ
jgi:hypothetical protein